ncbi:MAG: pyridoxamine 5'-phosphate oxidase family protein [Gammaproteobacteria bacterium]|nr:pyridoxamine 5'-phosphate oxidase family protein [Gammaproteobacteria bacterium]
MTHMTADEKQAFLADLHVGVLGINDPGKGPLTVPVWYDYEPGGQLWFLTGPASRKGKLLAVGDRISLCAQTETPPYQYVSVEGSVASIDEPRDEGLPMAVRYLGEERGRAYSKGSAGESVVVRMNCGSWLGVDYSKS